MGVLTFLIWCPKMGIEEEGLGITVVRQVSNF
jgi:hypothetical protein